MTINYNLSAADRAARKASKIANRAASPFHVSPPPDASPLRSVTVTGMPAFTSKPMKEGVWERVQRLRAEGSSLMKGRKHVDVPKSMESPFEIIKGYGQNQYTKNDKY